MTTPQTHYDEEGYSLFLPFYNCVYFIAFNNLKYFCAIYIYCIFMYLIILVFIFDQLQTNS